MDAVADLSEILMHLPFCRVARGAHTPENDLAKLLPVGDQEGPERCVRGVRTAVPLAPHAIVPDQTLKRWPIDISPGPGRGEGIDGLRRARQQCRGLVTHRAR